MARRPIDPPISITTEFGVTDSNAYFGKHSGVDYAVGSGTAVYAPAKGTVWWAGFSQTGGNMLIVFDGKYFHRLMHNSILFVTKGDKVTEGQHIANSGSTRLSTGPHVHWDIASEMLDALRPSSFDKFIDPAAWLKEAPQGGGDVITKDDLGPVRIIMSEVEGWNGENIHAGKHDAEIMSAWMGKQWTEMIWHCWKVQGIHRHNLAVMIAELQQKIAEAKPAGTGASVDPKLEALGKALTNYLGK